MEFWGGIVLGVFAGVLIGYAIGFKDGHDRAKQKLASFWAPIQDVSQSNEPALHKRRSIRVVLCHQFIRPMEDIFRPTVARSGVNILWKHNAYGS
jgi:membrane protein DedA with SNARE-associated domain